MVPRSRNSPLVMCTARLKGLICCVFVCSFTNPPSPRHVFHVGMWGTADVIPPAHNTKTFMHLTTHCTKHRTIWKQSQNSNQHPSYVHDTNWHRNCEQYRDTVKTVTNAHYEYVLQMWSRNSEQYWDTAKNLTNICHMCVVKMWYRNNEQHGQIAKIVTNICQVCTLKRGTWILNSTDTHPKP